MHKLIRVLTTSIDEEKLTKSDLAEYKKSWKEWKELHSQEWAKQKQEQEDHLAIIRQQMFEDWERNKEDVKRREAILSDKIEKKFTEEMKKFTTVVTNAEIRAECEKIRAECDRVNTKLNTSSNRFEIKLKEMRTDLDDRIERVDDAGVSQSLGVTPQPSGTLDLVNSTSARVDSKQVARIQKLEQDYLPLLGKLEDMRKSVVALQTSATAFELSIKKTIESEITDKWTARAVS